MAAPAAAVAARVASAAASNPGLRRVVLGFALALVALPLLFVTAAATVFSNYECGAGVDDDFGGTFDGPGSLGGVMGTGVTRSEVSLARSHIFGGSRIVPHTYVSTAYAPAAGGINCGSDCNATASGIRVNGGRRKVYIVASNPAMNKYGAIAYIWPNPYGWRGPFIIADTGGNFDGSDGRYRIDFYIWGDRGESRSNTWGRRNTRVSTAPIVSGGPTGDTGGSIDADPDDSQCEGDETGGTGDQFDAPDGRLSYPLGRRGHSLGGVAAHMARAWGNWQSDRAVDIGVPIGVSVYAVDRATVVKLGGAWHGGQANPDGFNITLRTATNQWFYTHLKSRVSLRVGQHVSRGQLLGVSGAANGVAHLHIACFQGDPEIKLGVPQ